jgi:hypothetical protein
MKHSLVSQTVGSCSRCGECCRWLPLIPIQQCKPHQLNYLRARGLKEDAGYFLANASCQHLREEEVGGTGSNRWGCAIYEARPATCPDFCGKTLSGGKRFYVPSGCTMASMGGGIPPTP